MNVFALTCFLTGIIAGGTGLFVYLEEKKQKINQIWFFFNLAIAIWSVGLGGTFVVNNPTTALLSQKILYIGTIFIPILFFQFCVTLIEKEEKFRNLFKINYFLAIIFLSSLFIGSSFIKYVKPRTLFDYWPIEVGWLYYPFLLWFCFNVIYSFMLLRQEIRKKELDPIKLKQVSIIYYGTLIGFIAGSANFLLDFNIVFPPIHNFFVISYIFFAGLAIARYHLFGIEVILTEILVGVIGILLLVQIFVAQSTLWRIVNGVIFVLFCIFGYLLIRGVFREIRRREELERINRAKTEFISITSHQLRTPLTVIKGYLSMVLEGVYGEVSEKVKKVLENIYLANERLIKLVNSFLNVSKIELGKLELELERADIVEIVESVVKEMEIAVKGKNLYLKFEKPKEVPKILIDKEKIREIILNLVDNAIKYTQEGGVEVKLQILNNRLQIVVADTGEGLTKEEKAKLFESFSRGSAGQKYWVEGAGIGLYVAKKIVELHQGKIWVESEGRGKGSKFYVELPIK
jgi:signal transduction histidine kinase